MGRLARFIRFYTDEDEGNKPEPGIWKTIKGALIHLTDALASPMQKCEVTLEPIQDLHGQDAPYPAGGGKNKWALGDRTVVGVEIIAFPTPIPAGNWTFSCEITSTIEYASALLLKENADGTGETVGSASIPHYSGRVSYSFGLTAEAKSVIIYAANAWNESQGQTTTFTDVQLESGTTATSYAPFENICPITGWTGCKVWVKDEYDTTLPSTLFVTFPALGKNLFDKSNVTNGYYLSSNGTPTPVSIWCYSDYIPVSEGDYIASGLSAGGSGTYCCIYDSSKNFVRSLLNVANQNLSFSIQSGEAFVRLSVRKSQSEIDTAMFEKGTSATAYEPYTNTVYSGTYDFVSGVGVADMAKVVLDGSQTGISANWQPRTGSSAWLYPYSLTNHKIYRTNTDEQNIISDTLQSATYQAVYNGDVANGISSVIAASGTPFWGLCVRLADDSLTTNAAINAYLAEHPITVVYELAEPITFTLTPQQINTLVGENNVWSNGDSVEITYKAQAE